MHQVPSYVLRYVTKWEEAHVANKNFMTARMQENNISRDLVIKKTEQ